jgi:dTDP-4-amino-4,6-dideoxygalactose transaminase
VKLRHLPAWNEARRRNAERYRRLIEASGLLGEVKLPVEPPERRHVYHQYIIRSSRRDALREHLAAHGVATAVYYPVPLHLQPSFADLDHARGSFPVAERAAGETLALPIYPELTEAQQAHIVHTIAGILQQ